MRPRAVASRLTHVDRSGRARMVDVGDKPVTQRVAIARGMVRMRPATAAKIAANAIAKGDVLATARIAGVLAAKRTGELIPLCHPLPLEFVDVRLAVDAKRGTVAIEAEARITARTGIEMEALTAVSVAALTIYDMCKAVDRGMTIEDVCLVKKSGGRSGDWVRPEQVTSTADMTPSADERTESARPARGRPKGARGVG
ncbi:cyclic pyranopterin monophosphate synthase MoaC, partial [Candidatus Binatia bacterium]|nr:cyclic pyranopterin monophosphate synthase MoaC [Candidatus Binatia bacterium]